MPAAYTELYMDQGATFQNIIYVTDDITGASINLQNYSVRSQMRRSHLAANASAYIVCSVSDYANGTVVMSLAAANTSNISAGRYFFDVEIESPANVVTRILEGIINVTPEYTK